MAKKIAFNPVISRVGLTPEQAVLSCSGYFLGYGTEAGGMYFTLPKQWSCYTDFLGYKHTFETKYWARKGTSS